MTKLQRKNKPVITIIGIGNTLYQDEGIGVHALPYLEDLVTTYENIEVIDGQTDSMRLLGPVEDAEYLIIIDAINAGKKPGELIELRGDQIPTYFGVKMSIHQIGFMEVLSAAKLRERYPKHIIMFGMQPASLELGVELSEIGKEQLPGLVEKVMNQVNEWRS
ncbi:hydrogenase maturation protease [Bacillus sp. HMF5848]|uniref:HyaD/HybD family hydrogenase maturation endopeptidase n=1 Tax=Bacillus sp. HMF5848 TaxID=2495421 RepID=UPI000F77BB6E|nr:HyaD/HybD family hydrogenase maturation endopeptidase [Bacillus sp. HMF5848]RSK27295.1 hydrogenase maturation protease [Bacillus sp. HMF5848]